MTNENSGSSEEAGCVLGVNVAAGTAYLVLVDASGQPSFNTTAKIVPASGVDEWTQLRRIGESFLAEAKANNVRYVAFAEPKRYNQWKYYDAYGRAAIQVAAGQMLSAAGIAVIGVAQRTAAATLGATLTNLEDKLKTLVGSTTGIVHWSQRWPALAVALHAAKTR